MDDMKDKIHSHDLRITVVEVNQVTDKEKLEELHQDKRKIIWLILSILVSSLVYTSIGGWEAFLQ